MKYPTINALKNIIKRFNLEVRKFVYYYKGGFPINYIMQLTIEEYFNEVDMLNKIIKEENKING